MDIRQSMSLADRHRTLTVLQFRNEEILKIRITRKFIMRAKKLLIPCPGMSHMRRGTSDGSAGMRGPWAIGFGVMEKLQSVPGIGNSKQARRCSDWTPRPLLVEQSQWSLTL